jgi:hypothetical protein
MLPLQRTWTRNSSHAARPLRPRCKIHPPRPHDCDTRQMYDRMCTIHACQQRQRWRRPIKVATLLLAIVCAGLMSCFANAHAHQVHRDKWAKLTRIVPLSAKGFTPPALADPPALLFLVASMSFTASTHAYYITNRDDVFQNAILLSGTMLGLLMALSLDLGILLGIFGLEQWFLLLSLVVSDVFHFVCVRRQRCEGCVSNQDFGDENA